MKKVLTLFFIFIPIGIFFIFFHFFMVNIPINDDYQAILKFINDCITTEDYFEKIKIIFSQHNEHRIVFTNLCSILCYKLAGNINFSYIALIGNISLLFTTFFYYKKFNEIGKNTILFLPVVILLFNFSHWENMTFAMASTANFTVILFSLISIHFLTKKELTNKTFYFSVLFYVLAVFTQGAGLILFPLQVLILIYKKQLKRLKQYILFSGVLFCLYFLSYNSPPQNTPILDVLLNYKAKLILYFIGFLGNEVNYFRIFTNENQDSLIYSSICGFVILSLVVYLTHKKYYKQNLFNFSTIVFVLFVAIITSLSRVANGIETAGASRYRIWGSILMISLYFFFLENKIAKKKIFTPLVLVVSISFFVLITTNHLEYLDYRKKLTEKGVLVYHSGEHKYLNGDTNLKPLYDQIIKESKKQQTYYFPSETTIMKNYPFSKNIATTMSKTTDLFFHNGIEEIIPLKDSFYIEGKGFLEGQDTKKQQIFVVLENQLNHTKIFFTSNQIKRYDINPYYKKENLDFAGFIAIIKKEDIQKGHYKLFLKVKNNKSESYAETDKQIKI
jgi:hypothetical protein